MTKLYKHKDYNEYYEAQVSKNIRKIKLVWIKPYDINDISNHINKYIPNAKFGICHGVRNAWEVKQLRKRLGIEVIGTEISPTAEQFANTIQWDFHNIKDEWVDNVDFIYSNSFDHSYKPSRCLDQWMKCIKKDGICYIHWMITNTHKIDSADCFAGTKDEYRNLFNKKYKVIDEFTSHPSRLIFAIKHK